MDQCDRRRAHRAQTMEKAMSDLIDDELIADMHREFDEEPRQPAQTEAAGGASELTVGLERLLPCPFCGAGETEITENGKTWTGMKYSAPVSVSVRHWCERIEGQPSRMIERIGRDTESAIAAWNMRSN